MLAQAASTCLCIWCCSLPLHSCKRQQLPCRFRMIASCCWCRPVDLLKAILAACQTADTNLALHQSSRLALCSACSCLRKVV